MSEILLDPQTLAAIESFDERFEGARKIEFKTKSSGEDSIESPVVSFPKIALGLPKIALGDELD